MGISDFITVQEAAGILGVTDSRVRQIIGAGHLPAKRVGLRMLLLPRAAVAWYASLPPVRGGRKSRVERGATAAKKVS